MEHKDLQECIRSLAMMVQTEVALAGPAGKTMQTFVEMNLKALDLGSKAADETG